MAIRYPLTVGLCSFDSTSSRVCLPAKVLIRVSAKSMAVPGPREVITLPSVTTGASR